MRRAVLFVFALAGCTAAQGSGGGETAANDTGTNGPDAKDASTTDAATTKDGGDTRSDGDAPGADAIEACAPRTVCNSGECGDIPAGDGCGGVLKCDPCSDGDVYCTTGPSMHQAQVTDSVNKVMTDHPELFDPVLYRDTSSWLVIDDAGYTAAVVANCNASGAVCISDPNDDHEIRVHGPTDHRAENYGIRVHSTNRTWTKFMGGFCETTAF